MGGVCGRLFVDERIHEYALELEQLRSDNAHILSSKASLQKRLLDKEETVMQRDRTIEKLMRDVAALRQRLSHKDETILKKNTNIDELRRELSILKNLVIHKDTQIDKYSNVIKQVGDVNHTLDDVLRRYLK